MLIDAEQVGERYEGAWVLYRRKQHVQRPGAGQEVGAVEEGLVSTYPPIRAYQR